MARCLYTYAELNCNSPADDATATLEHIVPYAIGGTDSFAIDYCSKRANNDFGRDIDAPFISLPVVGFKRHKLNLKSYSGKVPDIVFSGDCVELNSKCSIVFPHQGVPYADFGVSVCGGIDKGQISFSGSEDRLRDAVGGLLKKANRKGLTLLSSNLEPMTTVEEAVEASDIASGKTLHFRINFGHEQFFVPWSRGMVKMALGLGAIALGRTWAFSTEADVLRSCLLCEPASFPPSALKGNTIARIPADIARMIDVRAGMHTLAVLPHEHGMAAYISLFGGDLLDAMIDLGNGPADVRRVNDELPTSWKCVFRIDPTSRALTTLTLAEVNARLPNDEI